jgi:hypothetical protein
MNDTKPRELRTDTRGVWYADPSAPLGPGESRLWTDAEVEALRFKVAALEIPMQRAQSDATLLRAEVAMLREALALVNATHVVDARQDWQGSVTPSGGFIACHPEEIETLRADAAESDRLTWEVDRVIIALSRLDTGRTGPGIFVDEVRAAVAGTVAKVLQASAEGAPCAQKPPDVPEDTPNAPGATQEAARPVPIERIREALQRIHMVACGKSDRAYMSIPADPRRDADLILSAAIDELEALRAEAKPRPCRPDCEVCAETRAEPEEFYSCGPEGDGQPCSGCGEDCCDYRQRGGRRLCVACVSDESDAERTAHAKTREELAEARAEAEGLQAERDHYRRSLAESIRTVCHCTAANDMHVHLPDRRCQLVGIKGETPENDAKRRELIPAPAVQPWVDP